jgi:hypothetical protein
MCSERKHGLSTEQFPVSAYVGSSKNLKDLKVWTRSESKMLSVQKVLSTEGLVAGLCWAKSKSKGPKGFLWDLIPRVRDA